MIALPASYGLLGTLVSPPGRAYALHFDTGNILFDVMGGTWTGNPTATTYKYNGAALCNGSSITSNRTTYVGNNFWFGGWINAPRPVPSFVEVTILTLGDFSFSIRNDSGTPRIFVRTSGAVSSSLGWQVDGYVQIDVSTYAPNPAFCILQLWINNDMAFNLVGTFPRPITGNATFQYGTFDECELYHVSRGFQVIPTGPFPDYL